MEHHAEVLKGGVWQQRIPSWRDLMAVLLVLGTVILLGAGARQMVAPFIVAHQPEISLSRSDRVAKYNRLLEIEDELGGVAVFANPFAGAG